jgi:hypothetical protein
MIPNVFVSSTIADLQYLREVLRDALTELSYSPVMSEHGGVGYIHEGSAADACYVTMQQCHIAILIVGKRYGSIGAEGISVTHREFHTARTHEIPLITLVDADVMSFKKVFDADPESTTWDKFEHMDHPRETFKLVAEVTSSQIYNGLIEFRTATEAKSRLKQQLAHFMGDRLSGTVRPIKTDVHEILAEVKALRNSISHTGSSGVSNASKSADPFYISLRFLLEERNKDYTKFVESIFGDLDIAAHEIQSVASVDELIQKAGGTLEVIADNFDFRSLWQDQEKGRRLRTASESMTGSWAITADKHVYLSETMKINLNDKQNALSAKLK